MLAGLNWLIVNSGEHGSLGWIKLADCYLIVGNMGVWTGLNWLTVT